jgi:hypothetical protein
MFYIQSAKNCLKRALVDFTRKRRRARKMQTQTESKRIVRKQYGIPNSENRVKVKLSLCSTSEALRHEGVCGSGCIDPHFLDLGTSWS